MVDLSLKAKYKSLLGDLLPIGKAWDNVKSHALLDAMAVEFTRIQGRAADLLTEMYPGTSTELLEDFENLVGLPDECTPENQTISQRRAQVLQKLATTGGISAEYYIFIANQLGYDITIQTAKSFRAGISRAGDALTNYRGDSRFKAGAARAGDALNLFGWQFVYIVTVPLTNVIYFRAGASRAGEPLVLYANPLLQCTLTKLKPAHAGIYFRFTGD